MNYKQFRQQKDIFFGQDPHSPLTPEQQDEFEGLNYFDVNLDLCFELKIETFSGDEQRIVTMQTSTGSVVDYIRWGRISFEVEGEPAALTVYKAPEHNHFFLPFMDSTSGEDTYSGGRYLELEPLPGEVYLIDFNLAYNPYCAYNPPHSLFVKMGQTPRMLYSCPFPPQENRLSVPIRAGEKKPTGPWVEEDHA